MEKITNQEFGGERPLYCRHDLYLENVKIHAGESALKETSGITCVNCQSTFRDMVFTERRDLRYDNRCAQDFPPDGRDKAP